MALLIQGPGEAMDDIIPSYRTVELQRLRSLLQSLSSSLHELRRNSCITAALKFFGLWFATLQVLSICFETTCLLLPRILQVLQPANAVNRFITMVPPIFVACLSLRLGIQRLQVCLATSNIGPHLKFASVNDDGLHSVP